MGPRTAASGRFTAMNRRLRIGLLLCVAFWPLVPWYGTRVMAMPERLSAFLALLTACVVVWRDRTEPDDRAPALALPTALLLLYAVSYPFVPGSASAILAMLTIAAVASTVVYGLRMHVAVGGLLLLSLPLLSRMQFYLGYPLRVVVGTIAAPLLQLTGHAVVREGAVLRAGTELIVIDAPCSGIKMLWAAMYLTLTLCCFYRFPPRKTVNAVLSAFLLVLCGNVLRSTALFYFETGTLNASPAVHSGVGVAAFLGVAVGILDRVRRLDGGPPCVP